MLRFLLPCILLLAVSAVPLTAQDNGAPGEAADTATDASLNDEELHAIRLVSRSAPDSIVLRWGLTTYTAWKAAGRTGFVIERAEIRSDPNNSAPFVWRKLTTDPIHPLTMEQWKSRFAPEDSLAGAAVQTLYGKAVVTSKDPFGSIVELHTQQQNLNGFALLLSDMRPDLADGLGLRYVDRDVSPGRGYLYRITVAAPLENIELDTALVSVITRTPDPLPAINSLEAEEGEKKVVLRWDRYEHLDLSWSGYIIERSIDGGRTFSPRSGLPFMPVTPADKEALPLIEYPITVERNYVPVTYRVRGLSAFGELSPPGTEITAMGRDKTAPKQPAILPYEIVDEASVKIMWEVRDQPDADLDGFLIAKSVAPEGPYDVVTDLLPKTARVYIDANVDTLPAHYYTVSAVDTAGNSRMSAPVLALFPDSIPPMIPTGLQASIDSSGVVRLSWAPNAESDLQGYRVFYANDPSHEFQQLTTKITADTVFIDTLTLKTLSEEIYYKLTALDYNFNHSPFTEAFVVEKPDIVPPSAPLIHDIRSSENGVRVSWHRSPTSDAAEHIVVRRRSGESAWQRLDSLVSRAVTSFSDTTLKSQTVYEYAVYAYDDDGLRSPLSNIVTARKGTPTSYAAADNVAGIWDPEQRVVKLSWSYQGGKCMFHIYRTDSDAPARLYHTVEYGVLHFEDTAVSSGTYKYAVKAVYPDGGESAMKYTPTVTVP